MKTVKVAAVQFGAGTDLEANKKKILEMIDLAAEGQPDLIVLPEFVNHASWYNDKEHCYEVALDLSDLFIQTLSDKASSCNSYLVVNMTLRRGEKECTGSSILFNRQGKILAVSDKQVLMGHENDFLTPASRPTPIVETDIGRIGLYSCMDGVIAETPRDLATRGAQILCNSLNSFAVDEASLHVPVRAGENKVFIVAANKVGPLIPEDQLDIVSQMTSIPKHFLFGAGESQIVSPDGTVIAKASLSNEEVIFAEIQPDLADIKTRPDSNHIFQFRRPEIYAPLATEPEDILMSPKSKTVKAGAYQFSNTGTPAIEEACLAIETSKDKLDVLVFPELFFLPSLEDFSWREACELSDKAIESLQEKLSETDMYVSFSVLSENAGDFFHRNILLSKEGIVHQQVQIHESSRYHGQLTLGSELDVIELPFGKVGLVVGEDAIYPEVFRLLAIKGADLILVSGHVQETWEMESGFVQRSAENRICLAVASRPSIAGSSFLTNLHEDFTLLTPWKVRNFDGNINMPIIRKAPRSPGLMSFKMNLERTHNKILSSRTHVLNSRPWKLWPIVPKESIDDAPQPANITE